ncbi:bifunctional phosphopantothenoylcysteine decarboxylase/phosphopantothenate--cysteine ligase CoaBC [Thermomicrobiaceae bacterium CFH 74404]|uniref:Coenzyme A biosynthesis bifunctional protein CoaBC n=1 Tax=Thermalbibacter longus TaxID=2951981 RepID=A0AA41WA39_9BACT|nr:bifunctional phosphopantothenoylcysteine decarboxylase/phosphopantothenate--cysteine ligase CoaBC [Thermalbibacter longus]MCM8748271.1 bifunctional phosphopantothenoylcysteine decarboxylase/phosphopantothenate--cysteine ligase CoaBC [Thermalbibacter longus]
MIRVLRDRRIVLGVSGGIAAYKCIELARALTQGGALVDVILTEAALQFVTPLTFQALTRRPVHTTVFEAWDARSAGHVTLGAEADLIVVAPATANVIAKLAYGLADDALTVTALACPAPLIVAPAMDHHMYHHPATQANLRTLRERGAVIVGPESGPLASGMVGEGRLVEPERLLAVIRAMLGRHGPLAGARVVVTAGPTREPIDPIRFISNHSSGRMGYALAEAARDAGAQVTLITGPTERQLPFEVEVVHVQTAAEMAEAVQAAVETADALIMCAAVADYRPSRVAPEKIKKTEEQLSLPLERTIDILASVQRPGLVKVGFAAETERLLEHGRAKLEAKRLDLLVANDARETMGREESQAYLLTAEREPEALPRLPKTVLAEIIVDRVARLVRARRATSEVSDGAATATPPAS